MFFDIAQFYNHTSLEKAYEQNIAPLPTEYKDFKRNRSEFSKWFVENNKKRIIDYCLTDCKFTLELSNLWVKLFHDVFGVYVNRWLSSGYLAEKVIITHNVHIPLFNSIPCEIQDLAYRSYYGGRFEMLIRGFIGEGYLYDINSAYPHALTKLPDLDNGEWVNGTRIHPKAELGFFKIEATVPIENYITPFPLRTYNGINKLLIFPSGNFITTCTLHELIACENPDYYKILDSWQFIPNSSYYPLKDFIEVNYNKRLELKNADNPAQLPIKIILNSIYGKTGQTRHGMGNLFNPVIFAFTTGFTRGQMYKFVRDSNLNKEVVSFATDSLCVTKNLNLPAIKELGMFSLANSAYDVFMLQNGYYRFNGIWKSRGFGKDAGKLVEHIGIKETDGRLYLVLQETRSTRLRTAIVENRIRDIGKIQPYEKKINLNADRKRHWLTRLESVNS